MKTKWVLASIWTIALALILATLPGYSGPLSAPQMQPPQLSSDTTCGPDDTGCEPDEPEIICDPGDDEDEDEDDDTPQCYGDILSMGLKYTGKGCAATSNIQGGLVQCAGSANGYEPVEILVNSAWDTGTVYADESGVFLGDVVQIEASNAGQSVLDTDVLVKIDGGMELVEFHTSCSQPINVGDEFGSLKVVELTTTQGGTVTLAWDDLFECTLAKATVDPDLPSVLLEGSFCEEPIVFGGQTGGLFQQLPILDSGSNFILAELSGVGDLETCVIEVECPCKDCDMEVALSSGEDGPGGTHGTDRTDRTHGADRSPGRRWRNGSRRTDRADRTPGRRWRNGSRRTDRADRTPGRRWRNGSRRTDRADRTPGRRRRNGCCRTDRADRTPGRRRRNGCRRTDRADRTPGRRRRGRASRSDGCNRVPRRTGTTRSPRSERTDRTDRPDG